MTQRVLLCIMDGWGISTNHPEADATKLANPVHVNELEKDYPSISIHADGEYVGLPEGQMGNSEVGHLNLGAGLFTRTFQKLTVPLKTVLSSKMNVL